MGQTMTAVLERPELKNADTTGNAEDAHYFPKRLLTDAIVFGTPITALCGYVAIPFKNPEGRPTCAKCHEIWLTKNA